MNVFPLQSLQKTEFIVRSKKEVRNYVVLFPIDWWNSEITFTLENKEKSNFPEPLKTDISKLELHKNKQWTIANGDYFIKSVHKEKDYAYYRRLKEKVLKLLIFPFIIITTYTIYIISHFLSKISF